MQLHDRKTAIFLGLKKYYDGRPCRNGHLSYRDTKRYTCIICRDLQNRRYKQKATRIAITGVSEIKLLVHAKDRQTLIEFNEALTLARTLTESLK